jgi:hypothetical protein
VSDDHELTCEERLEATLAENQHLREQNGQLLKASTTFGVLAERLNTALQSERRLRVEDRRRYSRPGSVSRRTSPAPL